MSRSQVTALDRELDSLGRQQAGAGREAAAVLAPLAGVRAADWPDRGAGRRITAQVAAGLGPGQAAGRGRGQSAVPPVLPAPGRDGSGPSSRRRSRWLARPAGLTAVLACAAAVLVAAGAVLVAGGAGIPGRHQAPPPPYHSRFAAAAIAPGSVPAPGGRPSPAWQLVSYLTGAGWRAGQVGASAGNVSCPSAAVCYLTAARPVPVSGYNLPSPEYNILERTRDGGASWSARQLPADVSITTPLQCPRTVSTCYAAGYDAGRVVLLVTADAGRTWSARPVPGPLKFADELACSGGLRCAGLFETSHWAPGYRDSASNAVVLVTADAGRTWSAGPPAPRGQLPDYLTCRGSTCVLFDQLITTDNSRSVSGNGQQTVAPGSWAAWYSHDGGMSWQRGQHPGSAWTMASHDLPLPGTISCAGPLHCWAAMSSQVGEPGIATAFLSTSDGGRRWTVQQLPVQRARQFIPLAMSCPTARQCYAGGGDSAGPVILTTVDGGVTWSPVSLPAAPAGNVSKTGLLPAVGLLSCAAAAHCLAALQTDGSAASVPVFSLGAWQG
jgi:hypothetical protein